MRKVRIICLLMIFSAVIVIGQTNTQEEWSSIIKKDFSIEYPKDWQLDNSGQMGSSFILFSQLTKEDDKFRENVNLIIQDLSGYNISLDKFVEISENQIRTMITDSNILSSKRIKKDTEFQEVIYTGRQGLYDFKYVQYYFVTMNKVYILTFTTEINEFDRFEKIGKNIMNSFRFK